MTDHEADQTLSPEARILGLIANETWQQTREVLRPDCCIEATGIVIAAANYFKINLEPTPVRVWVFNAKATELSSAGITWHDWPLESGAYMVAIDERDEIQRPPGSWPGHLIAAGRTADGRAWLVDASLPQMERLAKGIVLHPLATPASAKWPGFQGFRAPDGAISLYYEPSGLMTFREAPAWRNRKRFKRIVGQVIRVVRESI